MKHGGLGLAENINMKVGPRATATLVPPSRPGSTTHERAAFHTVSSSHLRGRTRLWTASQT